MPELVCHGTLEDIAYQISSHPFIIENWSYIAHHLGYGWCAGTGSSVVGRDFYTRRLGDLTYETKANYRSSDPVPLSAPLWTKRLKLTFSHFNFHIANDQMQFGRPIVTSLKSEYSGTITAKNLSDEEASMSYQLSKSVTSSVTHTTSESFHEGFNFRQKWSVGVPGLASSETEYQVIFDSTKGWSNATLESNTITANGTFNVKVPPYSKKEINIFLMKTENKVPYTAKAFYAYHVTLDGFLRYSWNARRHVNGYHVLGRPSENYTFGTETWSALDHLNDSATHVHIPDYDPVWNWNACLNPTADNDSRCIFDAVNRLENNLPYKVFSGEFKHVYGNHFSVTTLPSERLTSADYEQQAPQADLRLNLENGNQLRVKSRSLSRHSFFEVKDNTKSHTTVQSNQNQQEIVWVERNGNHKLRRDGIVLRGHTLFSQKQSDEFIRDHHLKSNLPRR